MIEFDNVSMTFYTLTEETKALENISININKGEIVAIIGPSGSGKTTILNIISGLLKQSSGEVKIKGKVGYMFQQDNLLEWYNVRDNISIGLKIKHEKNDELINHLMQEYGLMDFSKMYPSSLSGGMRQRVALIRTLVVNPEILLLDEPFCSLDAQTKIVVIEEVKRIIKKEEKTTVIVTHDINEALRIADRVIVLSNRPAHVKSEYLVDGKEHFKEIWDDLINE